jgi:DNA excision repair protein ERCC-3
VQDVVDLTIIIFVFEKKMIRRERPIEEVVKEPIDLVEDGFNREKALHDQSSNSSDLVMHRDHESRPCYVCKNGSIYVEMRSKHAHACSQFLLAIADPISRPEFVHHYKLTAYSLYAGACVDLNGKQILEMLRAFSKNVLPTSVVNFVTFFTATFGKVSLVLRRNRVFVQSKEDEILRKLMINETIRTSLVTTTTSASSVQKRVRLDDGEGEDDEQQQQQQDAWFEIDPTKVGVVKKQASMMNYPMMEEYDYMKDDRNPDLDIRLKGNVQTRYYQDEALKRMFSSKRAKSGVIVLPCGAGKTLTGISACCTIHKNTLVVCSNTMACHQWIEQFLFFTNVSRNKIFEFTGTEKEPEFDTGAVILVTTYHMLGMREDNRSESSKKTMEALRAREWGLSILDEVHMAPADTFRQAIFQVKTHCKLGLTATLVREDGQIGDLNFLIGPKLYEADWMRLTNEGYLARVTCAEVQCPMSSVFMKSYLKEDNTKIREALYVMNPNKFAACRFLMTEHEKDKTNKILIFSDSLASIKFYGVELHRYYMHGETSSIEREQLLERFRLRHGCKTKEGLGAIQTLIISKIGDVALDLPHANVLIQVSSHYGSRRQEAQRVGRVMRPKADGTSVFYSLVSNDTTEMKYAFDRQEFLMNQGYKYKIVEWNMLFKQGGDAIQKEEQERMLKIVKEAKKV